MKTLKKKIPGFVRGIAVLGMVWGAIACSSATENDKDEVSGAEVREELNEAAQATGKKIEQEKEEFVADMRRLGKDMDTKIDRLKVRMEGKTGKAREKIKEEINELEKKKGNLNDEIEKVEKSSAKAWKEIKEGANKVAADIRQFFKNVEEDVEKEK